MIHRHAADKQVVGFIPARGGSKSIPKKNLVDLTFFILKNKILVDLTCRFYFYKKPTMI